VDHLHRDMAQWRGAGHTELHVTFRVLRAAWTSCGGVGVRLAANEAFVRHGHIRVRRRVRVEPGPHLNRGQRVLKGSVQH
jgi:hypothetical protein